MTTEPEEEVTEAEAQTASPEVETGLSDEESLSGGAQRQRAGAAAAYAAAQHSAPSKAETESGLAEDQVAEPLAEGDPGEPEPPVQLDLDELAAKAEKADQYLLLAQRTQADFENFRKRATRDAALAQERGIAKLARELLPAVDNLDRALQAAATYVIPAGADADGDSSAEDGRAAAAGNHEIQLIDGLKLVQAEVLAALARVGIEPFSPVGEPFDPQHHEAVAKHEFEDQAPGTVVEVYQQGFRHGESVLRPARVLVAA
jgi:molecular chaperone GrpE